MSDFTSGFWSFYIALITLVSILACAWLLRALTTRKLAPGEKPGMMGHVWDETLGEYNNPLPRWWMWLFYITILFALGYLAFYPGLGTFSGVGGWSSAGQYQAEQEKAKAAYGPIYERFGKMSVEAVAADPAAREMGQHLFLNHCAQCHASDARGGPGFPDLTDKDWLYGGTPEQVKTSITQGRQGVMPPMGAVLGDQGAKDVAHYVMSVSGGTHDALRASRGKPLFETNCAVCHGADAKGNPTLGAPNLTDGIWLYGAGESTLITTITKGRAGKMPPWGEFLGESKTHLLAAYVYGLSNPPAK